MKSRDFFSSLCLYLIYMNRLLELFTLPVEGFAFTFSLLVWSHSSVAALSCLGERRRVSDGACPQRPLDGARE